MSIVIYILKLNLIHCIIPKVSFEECLEVPNDAEIHHLILFKKWEAIKEPLV